MNKWKQKSLYNFDFELFYIFDDILMNFIFEITEFIIMNMRYSRIHQETIVINFSDMHLNPR